MREVATVEVALFEELVCVLLVFEDAELRQRELRQRVCERLDLDLVLVWNRLFIINESRMDRGSK